MEFNIVRDASLKFKNDGVDKFCTLQNAVESVTMTLLHVTGSHTHQKFQNKTNSSFGAGSPGDTGISCTMRLGKMKDDTEDQLQIMWTSSGPNSFFHKLSPQIKPHASFQMKMEIEDVNSFQKVSPITSGKSIFQRESLSGVAFSLGPVPDDLANKWRNQNGEIGTISGTFSLNFILDEDYLGARFRDTPSTNHCLLALAKMLENKSECDTIITSASGATVKCNRAFLSASCPYFQAMFQSEMQESRTNQIDMTNFSEAEIRAFLGYLYKGDVKPALADIQMAWTLLKAGNYYQLDSLVLVMREILMVRKYEKYSIDLALEMLFFAKDVSGDSTTANVTNLLLKGVWNDLTLKAVLVLKWYSKERPLELMASEKYNKLYVETPQLAMKLHSKFLQYLDEDEFEKKLDGAANFMD